MTNVQHIYKRLIVDNQNMKLHKIISSNMNPSSTAPFITNQNEELTGQITIENIEDIRSRILSKSQLKSKIPKPVPYVRVRREMRSKSCSSSYLKGSSASSTSTLAAVKKRSLSQSARSSSEYSHISHKSNHPPQPNSLSTKKNTKNHYSYVKAKIDNKTPVSFIVKNYLHSNDCLMQSNNPLGDRRKIKPVTIDTVKNCPVVGDRDEGRSLIIANNYANAIVDDSNINSYFKGEKIPHNVDGISGMTVETQENLLVGDSCKYNSHSHKTNESFIKDKKNNCNYQVDNKGNTNSHIGEERDYNFIGDDRSNISSLCVYKGYESSHTSGQSSYIDDKRSDVSSLVIKDCEKFHLGEQSSSSNVTDDRSNISSLVDGRGNDNSNIEEQRNDSYLDYNRDKPSHAVKGNTSSCADAHSRSSCIAEKGSNISSLVIEGNGSSHAGDKNNRSCIADERSNISSLVDGRHNESSSIGERNNYSHTTDPRSKASSLVDSRHNESSSIGERNNYSHTAHPRSNASSLVDSKHNGSSSIGERNNYSNTADSRSNVSTSVDDRSKNSGMGNDNRLSVDEPPGDQNSGENPPNVALSGKERKPFTTSQSSDSHPRIYEQAREGGDVITLKRKDFFTHTDDTKNYLLKECAPEFLSSFVQQVEEVIGMWHRLIYDTIEMKMTIGRSASPRRSDPGPEMGWRDEIVMFFQNLPTQGELLHGKLCKIEEEQMNILEIVIQNIVALIKEHEELKRKHTRLKETYQTTQSQLKEELAILDQENKELDQKYLSVVEKCELEKLRNDEVEEHQVEILRKMLELRKVLKNVEGKCAELEKRGERLDKSRTKLEDSVRDLEESNEKEYKKYDELLNKYTESKKVASKLKQEINRSKKFQTSLEGKVKELEDEITDLKSNLESNEQKRSELEKEISDKNKKIKHLETEVKQLETEIKSLETSKAECNSSKEPLKDENSLELVKDLVKNVEKRNLQIQEFKKKINRLEYMVREKSNREERLLLYVTKLNKKCTNCCSSLNTQIKQLQGTAKGLQGQVSGLEKVLGQKTVELVQRDRLIRDLRDLLRSKKESDSPSEGKKTPSSQKMLKSENDNEAHSRHKKMVEMFSLLELKQMEIMKLERRIMGLQKFHDNDGRNER